jgi:hypothetical protein
MALIVCYNGSSLELLKVFFFFGSVLACENCVAARVSAESANYFVESHKFIQLLLH